MIAIHRLHSSSFLGLPYRIPNISHRKELLWSLWVGIGTVGGRGVKTHFREESVEDPGMRLLLEPGPGWGLRIRRKKLEG